MVRYGMRLLVAVLTFTIGIASPLIVKRILHPGRGFTDCVITFDPDDIPPTGFDSAKDVNEIYRLLVHETLTSDDRVDLVVLQAESTSYPLYEDESFNRELGHHQTQPLDRLVSEAMPEVETRTLLDYLAKNRTSAPLQVSNLGVNYVLVNSGELSHVGLNLFWTTFYQKYPRASGILFFSQIGFNPARDQAFVYAAKTCGGLCGNGSYVLLSKVNGKWKIVKDMGLWDS